jgi:hypothetical protein
MGRPYGLYAARIIDLYHIRRNGRLSALPYETTREHGAKRGLTKESHSPILSANQG